MTTTPHTTTPTARASSRDDIARELTEVVHYAKRQTPKVGAPTLPTRWDDAHEMIDLLLHDWDAARGADARP